jgi:hypothetical protein
MIRSVLKGARTRVVDVVEDAGVPGDADIAPIAAPVGEPAPAAALIALLDARAPSASAPACTLSRHLARLVDGGLVSVTHVGLIVGPGEMVDAPHTGAQVRVEAFPPAAGAIWGSEVVIGYTRPSGYAQLPQASGA